MILAHGIAEFMYCAYANAKWAELVTQGADEAAYRHARSYGWISAVDNRFQSLVRGGLAVEDVFEYQPLAP
ncbi:hypothetical protein DEM27_10395 [Metarhizobium album]|uniref:Uncharacterized protein n=1 Tax=Metarhizobium album TaxID=2182425 RepID=A0A2U2DTX6_9HYPH|nr:hypothetical protein DEM27_10395 [Rhizobium album]